MFVNWKVLPEELSREMLVAVLLKNTLPVVSAKRIGAFVFILMPPVPMLPESESRASPEPAVLKRTELLLWVIAPAPVVLIVMPGSIIGSRSP